jgi:hypothetical protein
MQWEVLRMVYIWYPNDSGHFYHFMMTMYPFKHRTILDAIESNDTL